MRREILATCGIRQLAHYLHHPVCEGDSDTFIICHIHVLYCWSNLLRLLNTVFGLQVDQLSIIRSIRSPLNIHWLDYGHPFEDSERRTKLDVNIQIVSSWLARSFWRLTDCGWEGSAIIWKQLHVTRTRRASYGKYYAPWLVNRLIKSLVVISWCLPSVYALWLFLLRMRGEETTQRSNGRRGNQTKRKRSIYMHVWRVAVVHVDAVSKAMCSRNTRARAA